MKQAMSILKSKRGVISLIVIILALTWIFIVLPATATDGEVIPGNVSCQDLGFAQGFKIDPPISGLYSIDSQNTVSLNTSDGVYFGWSSTLYMDAVIVKGGPNSMVYRYNPVKNSDTGLHSQIDPNNGNPYGLSHVEFCWETPPVIHVTKTANPVEVSETGGEVTFTVQVENQSQPQDPVTITSLVDDVYGDLNGKGTCVVPQTIQPGKSYECSFTATVSGNAGFSETDTVTASGTDDEGTPVSDSDNATVTVFECTFTANQMPLAPECGVPVIQVTKTANPVEIPAPGGLVTFTIKVENKSNPHDPVTITSLKDDIYGNILDLSNEGGKAKPEISTTCSLPQLIQPGGSYECTFTATVSGNVGYSETDTVCASGTDDENTPASDCDDAKVTVTEAPPVIQVTKTADPVQIPAPGGPVTFTVVVENQSSPTDPVTITSLTDDIYGNLLDLTVEGGTAKPELSTTCLLPQLIQPGNSYECQFTAIVSGGVGHSETDTVTASGADDEGTPVSDFDDASVAIIGPYKVFLPLTFSSPVCGSLGSFGATIGFEDLQLLGKNDFDYNDWITDIQGRLDYNAEPNCGLRKMDLTFTPQARGATYDHAFHFSIPANTFTSDGTATLTLFDQNHNPISSVQMAFIASADNDFTIFPKTSDVFPPLTNTVEGMTSVLPARTAQLSIEFSTPGPFVYSPTSLNSPHGEGLFFDPYLHVFNWNGDIHRGDVRLLAVPVATYLWPEETINISQVYQAVQFTPGNPPTLNFAINWWLFPHNECVFGDGIVCHLLP